MAWGLIFSVSSVALQGPNGPRPFQGPGDSSLPPSHPWPQPRTSMCVTVSVPSAGTYPGSPHLCLGWGRCPAQPQVAPLRGHALLLGVYASLCAGPGTSWVLDMLPYLLCLRKAGAGQLGVDRVLQVSMQSPRGPTWRQSRRNTAIHETMQGVHPRTRVAKGRLPLSEPGCGRGHWGCHSLAGPAPGCRPGQQMRQGSVCTGTRKEAGWSQA